MSNPKATTAPTNPYLEGRREWSERYGSHIQQATTWRAVALASLAVAGASVAGLVYSINQVKMVPYVVEVDKLHATLPIGPADRAAKADPRIIRAQLAGWVENIRSVYLDAAAEQRAVRAAYALLDSKAPAYQVVGEHMRDHDPFKRAQMESVSVDVQTVLPVGGDTWRVEWVETVRARDGTVSAKQNWQAVITTAISPPTDEAGVLTNPMGVFVTGVSWSARAN